MPSVKSMANGWEPSVKYLLILLLAEILLFGVARSLLNHGG